MPITELLCPMRPVTSGPRHHFFGYYDKTPWDASGRYLLALAVDFIGRPPEPTDVAVIGLVDSATGHFDPVAETRAWNWQQGAMLHWLPSAPERQIVFNDRIDGHFVSVILDVQSGRRRLLPRPVYAISHDGRLALSPNFSRLAGQRPGYGYVGVPDPWAGANEPDDDGIFRLDLATGEHRLLLSIRAIARVRRRATMEGVAHWLNHLQFSPDDRRFVVLHRWRRGDNGWSTQMLTAAPDGADLCCVADDEMVSHFDWRDPEHLLAWARQPDQGNHYYLFHDRHGTCEPVGTDVLTTDGHCSYSPDGRWLLTDTYPDAEQRRTLILYDPATNRRIDIGRFYSPPDLRSELRCDLHPRWSRDGRQVCIDSAHTGERQLYLLDVAAVTEG